MSPVPSREDLETLGLNGAGERALRILEAIMLLRAPRRHVHKTAQGIAKGLGLVVKRR